MIWAGRRGGGAFLQAISVAEEATVQAEHCRHARDEALAEVAEGRRRENNLEQLANNALARAAEKYTAAPGLGEAAGGEDGGGVDESTTSAFGTPHGREWDDGREAGSEGQAAEQAVAAAATRVAEAEAAVGAAEAEAGRLRVELHATAAELARAQLAQVQATAAAQQQQEEVEALTRSCEELRDARGSAVDACAAEREARREAVKELQAESAARGAAQVSLCVTIEPR